MKPVEELVKDVVKIPDTEDDYQAILSTRQINETEPADDYLLTLS